MKAVLLAAGRGTRLAPITNSVPKILAPLGGRPLLEHQLRYLERNGVTGVAVNVHHHAGQVIDFLDASDRSLEVRVSHEPELLGTAGALLPLREYLTEPFLVLYGDVVTTEPLEPLLEAHGRRGAVATLCVYRSSETAAKGLCTLSADGRIASFAEKPGSHAGAAWVNAGLYALDPAVFEHLAPERPDFGHDVWPHMLRAGVHLHAHAIESYLRDVGSVGALRAAERDLAAGVLRW